MKGSKLLGLKKGEEGLKALGSCLVATLHEISKYGYCVEIPFSISKSVACLDQTPTRAYSTLLYTRYCIYIMCIYIYIYIYLSDGSAVALMSWRTTVSQRERLGLIESNR